MNRRPIDNRAKPLGFSVTKLRYAAACFIGSLALAGQLRAATLVDFESVASTQFGGTIAVDAFQFDFISAGAWAIGPAPIGFGGNDNGTATLLVNASEPPVEVSMIGGGAFTLTGFDAAVGVGNGTISLDIVGTLLAGGTVSHSVSIDATYDTYLLPASFNSLMQKVRFSPTSSAGFSLDNLTGVIPEPSTFLLAALGLLPLRVARRRP